MTASPSQTPRRRRRRSQNVPPHMSPAAPDSTGLSSELLTGETNVGGEEERLDTAAARRQAVATLAQRRSEAASQSALDASSPINSQRRTPKRVRGGNSILKKAWIN